MVILHGLFGSNSNWRSIARRLSTNRAVTCLDLRNHGQSPWHDDMDYPSMASDVARFIEDHKLMNSILVGHSMGGKTVMSLLLDNLVPVSKSIIVDIAPVSYSHDHLELLTAMKSMALNSAQNRDDIDKMLSAHIKDTALRTFLLQNAVRDENGYRWRINIESIYKNMSHLIDFQVRQRRSTTPTLFVAGGNSDYVLPKDHPQINAAFPCAQIEIVENAGHWLHAEKPSALLNLITRLTSEA